MSNIIWEKIQNYCSYQDRSTQEVRQKLRDLETAPELVVEYMNKLIEYKFLDEKRFARSFVRGKFQFKKWGKIKIRQEIRAKGVDNKLVQEMLDTEIEPAEYEAVLYKIIAFKNRSLREPNPQRRRQKLAQHALGKGFESHLVWKNISLVLEADNDEDMLDLEEDFDPDSDL